MADATHPDSMAGDRYLLLVDISGYTAFLANVERTHGVDLSAGIPAGYGVLGELLGGVIEGVQPEFEVAKLEGDAVFAMAPAATLDGQGDRVLRRFRELYAAFVATRDEQARFASDHVCTACPVVADLELKAILHRGPAVRQTVGAQTELLGPAVNVVHRLLKNSIRADIDDAPYVFLSDAATEGLGLSEEGVAHREEYADVGAISGRVLPFDPRRDADQYARSTA